MTTLGNGKKSLVITNARRVPTTLSLGVCCSITQRNKVDAKIKTPLQCRKEMLIEIKECKKEYCLMT